MIAAWYAAGVVRPTTWMATEGERAQGLHRSFMPWLEEQIDKGTLTELTSFPRSITSLPERLGECKALQTLDLYRCSALTSLPESLGKCKGLCTDSGPGLLRGPDLAAGPLRA